VIKLGLIVVGRENSKKTDMKAILAGCLVLLTISGSQAAIIANWTFETSAPATAGPIAPEIGGGTASASVTTGGTVSSPAGNGSAHSFSANGWNPNEYFQFQVSTIGFTGISISWDQVSSGTGPRDFGLFYSTDGANFTQFGASYVVLANAAPNPVWNSTTASGLYSYASDLSSIAALDNLAAVYFRLVDLSTVSASGGTVGTTGTDRVDNVLISGAAVPEPSTWVAGALLALPFGLHGVRYLRSRKRA
jgi:hypothetical protein